MHDSALILLSVIFLLAPRKEGGVRGEGGGYSGVQEKVVIKSLKIQTIFSRQIHRNI